MNFPVSRVDRHDPLHVLILLLVLAGVVIWLFLRG